MGFRILQNETGIIYDNAIDMVPCPYTYSEVEEDSNEEILGEEFLAMIEEVL
jgi:hypothetical protein